MLVLKVIHLACQQSECAADIGSAQLGGYLVRALVTTKSTKSTPLILDTMYTLLCHTTIVKEALLKGGTRDLLFSSFIIQGQM